MEILDTILTVREAAERSSVGRARIDAAIAMGELRIIKLGAATRRIRVADLEKWWRSKRAHCFGRRITAQAVSDHTSEPAEPERLLRLAEAAKRCEIETSKLWAAHWSGQLDLVVLGPHLHRVLLSELDQWRQSVKVRG